MAKKTSYLDHLAGVPLFSSCTRKELQLLGQLCEETSVKAGKALVKQGAVGYECFVIVEGEASVDRNGRIITTFGPGAYFGELALLDKGPRSATVTALTDMTVLVLGPREFATAIDRIPGLSHRIMAGLARRLREMDVRLAG